MYKWIGAWMLPVLLLPGAQSAAAQQLSLESCQKLKNDIHRLTELRRNGGKSAQMDSWKRSRREHELAYRTGNCRLYRYQLE